MGLHLGGASSAGDVTSVSGGSQTSHDLDFNSSDDVLDKFVQQEVKGESARVL